MRPMVNMMLLACLVGYFDRVRSSIEAWIEYGNPYLDEITGVVRDRKGNDCTYFEIGGGKGSGPRTLNLKCRNPSCGQMTECNYRCDNPHRCSWYNNRRNKPKFYRNLAKDLAKEPGGACSVSEIESDDCPGIFCRQ